MYVHKCIFLAVCMYMWHEACGLAYIKCQKKQDGMQMLSPAWANDNHMKPHRMKFDTEGVTLLYTTKTIESC